MRDGKWCYWENSTQQKGPSGPPIEFGNQESWKNDAVEKTAHSKGDYRDPQPRILGIRWVGEKMLEWEHVPETLGPQAPSWAAQENGKETLLWPEEWGSICCSSVRSPTPSHTQPFQIKWEVYFSKEVCRSSLLCRRYDSACICIGVCNTIRYSLMSYLNFWWEVLPLCREVI